MPKLEEAIGLYEMSAVARTFCINQDELHIPTDKSCLMRAIESAEVPENQLQENMEHPENDISMIEPEDAVFEDEPEDDVFDEEPVFEEVVQPPLLRKHKIAIIDGMAEVRCLKKRPSTKTLLHLQNDFVGRIDKKFQGMDEGILVFDPYPDKQTLKESTHNKRQCSDVEYQVHLGMKLTMTLKELLSSSKTKRSITKIFAKAVLQKYSSRINFRLTVIVGNKVIVLGRGKH